MPANIPFKAKISGNDCILVVNDGYLLVKFEQFQKSFNISYGDMRCIRYDGSSLLINAQKNDRLVAYAITSSAAKKIHNGIIDKLQ